MFQTAFQDWNIITYIIKIKRIEYNIYFFFLHTRLIIFILYKKEELMLNILTTLVQML